MKREQAKNQYAEWTEPCAPVQVKFYATRKMYEFLGREARELKARQYGSKAAVFHKYLFKEGWERRLRALQKKQRAAGIPDHEFYDNAKLKEMGLPPHNVGARPRRRPDERKPQA